MYLGSVSFDTLLDHAIHQGALSAAAIADILHFRVFGNPQGFLLLPNQPIGDIPATPADRQTLAKADYHSEWLLLQATALLGDPIGYPQESDGSLINNVFPQATQARQLSSDSFDTELDLHTENAFHQVPPDFLALLCLRAAPQDDAITYIASVEKMLQVIDAETTDLLFQETFNFLSDYCLSEKSCRIDLGRYRPMLYGQRARPYLRFDPHFMLARSAQMQRLIEEIKEIAWSVAQPIRLAAGDLLIIDNRRAAHARSAFQAQFDGSDRWIQRTFAISHQRQLIGETGEPSRIIDLRLQAQ